MSDDPLDKTTSIGAELTKSGLSVNARSRAVAALDRLLGNAVDYLNLPIERRNVQQRARIEGERQLLEAMKDHALEKMKVDPEFADRAIQNYFRSLTSRQENKDSVARQAIEDLKRIPASEDRGPPELDPTFVNKFERHAEDASTDALREKWGRVLAAEIRRPGTISPRVMRIVDEIDSETAQLFEEFCCSRLSNVVPLCLHGKLEFRPATRLVGADLLVDPGLTGQIRKFTEVTDSVGQQMWFVSFENWGLGVARDAKLQNIADDELAPLRFSNGIPVIPVYVLTDAGRAVSSILPETERATFDRYLDALRSYVPWLAVAIYTLTRDKVWKPDRRLPPLASDSSP